MLELIQLFQFENGGILIAEIIHFIQMFDVFNALMCAAGLCFLLLILHNVRKVYQNKLEHLSEITTCSPHTETLSILIVGGTKSGKTSTLKSLAGHGRHTSGTFSACPNLKYVRNDDAYGWKIFAVKCENERRSASDDCDDIQTFAYNLGNIVKFLDNFHVIVYCLPFQSAMTNESNEYIKVLRSVLGDSIFKRHVIFGFTHGDVFEETKHEKGFNNFIDWLYGMGTSVLKNGLKDCNNRGVLLHNKSANEETRKGQINNICSMCMDIVWEKSSLRLSDDYGPQRELHHSYVGHGSSSNIHPYYQLDLKPQSFVRARQICEVSGRSLESRYGSPDLPANSRGDLKYRMIQSHFHELKENIDEMYQEGIFSFEEKIDIEEILLAIKRNIRAEYQKGIFSLEDKMDTDETPRVIKRKYAPFVGTRNRQLNKRPVDALFEAIYRHRNDGSVDMFLKILKEKYFSLHESWKSLNASSYDTITAHGSYYTAKRYGLAESSSGDDDFPTYDRKFNPVEKLKEVMPMEADEVVNKAE